MKRDRGIATLLLVKLLAGAALLGLLAYGAHRVAEGLREDGRREVRAEVAAREAAEREQRESIARDQRKFNDKAAGDHAQAVSALQSQLGNAREEIARLSGRPCLSGRTVGVLNATGVQVRDGAAAGKPASPPEGAAAGGDERFATDADVARAIAICRTEHGRLSDQLNRILDIEDKRFGSP